MGGAVDLLRGAPVEFTVPGRPPSMNRWTRQHWAARRNTSERWNHLIWAHARRAGARLIEAPALVTVTFYNPTPIDPDNHAKFVLDGLVGRVIVDDCFPALYELRLRNRYAKTRRTVIRAERADMVEGDPAEYRAALDALAEILARRRARRG